MSDTVGIDPGLIGAIIGGAVGAVSFFFFSSIFVDVMEEQSGRKHPIYRALAYGDLIFYPVLGHLIGWYFFT
ncbi:MAG: hypothetical protein AAFQ44_09730 [Pseudomonadota bacterium]